MSSLFRDLPLRIHCGCILSSCCSIACRPLSRVILPMQGLVYTITDVLELHNWMCTHFEGHPLFEHVPLEELVSWGPTGSCEDAVPFQSGSVFFEPSSMPVGWDGSLGTRGRLRVDKNLLNPSPRVKTPFWDTWAPQLRRERKFYAMEERIFQPSSEEYRILPSRQ